MQREVTALSNMTNTVGSILDELVLAGKTIVVSELGIDCKHRPCFDVAYQYTEHDIVHLRNIQNLVDIPLASPDDVRRVGRRITVELLVLHSTDTPSRPIYPYRSRGCRLTKILRHTLHVFVINGFL